MMHNVHGPTQVGLATTEHISTAANETAAIPLSRGMFAIVDASDAEWLSHWKWQALAARNGRFYAVRDSGRILMHREILQPPSGFHCDHIDNDSLRNVRSNLRVVTRAQNAQNSPGKRRKLLDLPKGVYPSGNRFSARIMAERKYYILGSFPTPEEAHNAYCEASARLHGEFGRVA